MHIDPKAPAASPQHPANWRRPQFLAPGAYTMDGTPPAAVSQPPAQPATPPKQPADAPKPPRRRGKKVTHASTDLAAALAELDET